MTYIDATKAAQVIAGLPTDATDEMVASALAVNWDIEDEKALVHNIWHAMTGAFLRSTRPSTALLDETVPQAAKLAAVKAYVEIEGKCRPVAMTAALTAAFPFLSAPCALEAKKLKWRKPTDHPQDMEGECSSVANGIGGRYSISNPERNKDGVYGWLLYLADDEFKWEWFPSIAEAKAAAQADFERRILSCVVTKPVDVAAVRRQAVEDLTLPIVGSLFVARGGATLRGVAGLEKGEDENSPLVRLSDVAKALEPFRALSAEPAQHPDDTAVDNLARLMKAKLAQKREEGRSGWQHMNADDLTAILRQHVDKGDPVDVANLCMMLSENGQRITPAEPVDQWQPIETAPKDGARFLATLSNGWIVILSETGQDRYAWYQTSSKIHIPVARTHTRDSLKESILATHWMPLPAAPTTEAGK